MTTTNNKSYIEIVYDNPNAQNQLKAVPFKPTKNFKDTGFYKAIHDSFYIRLSPELIARELVFFLICFTIFLYAGNGGAVTDSKDFNSFVLYLPVAIAFFQFSRASLISMLPGLICTALALLLQHFRSETHYLYFISPKELTYLLGIGLIMLPASFLKSF